MIFFRDGDHPRRRASRRPIPRKSHPAGDLRVGSDRIGQDALSAGSSASIRSRVAITMRPSAIWPDFSIAVRITLNAS